MSYSRFSDSSWYVYPSVEKCIQCFGPGFVEIKWKPEQTLDEFLEEVKKNDVSEEDIDELKEILLDNVDDIKNWFAKWTASSI